jgi:hypothetical protein
MSSEEHTQDPDPEPEPDTQARLPTGPAAMAVGNKKRPRLDLNVEGARERKRGKSMFGILLGTLNKAKIEDKERNASEAAKKRQLIDQRLQNKLRKETDSVRRAEEAKKDKTASNRKEEELQLKDSIYKLRRTQLPLLANFLLTSDDIPSDGLLLPSKDPLSLPPRTHPPPLYYLPALLTSAQETFLSRRKPQVSESAAKEWLAFREERTVGIEEINELRKRVAKEEEQSKTERRTVKESEPDQEMIADDTAERTENQNHDSSHDVEMDVDSGAMVSETKEESREVAEPDRRDEPVPIQADDDDAVEY